MKRHYIIFSIISTLVLGQVLMNVDAAFAQQDPKTFADIESSARAQDANSPNTGRGMNSTEKDRESNPIFYKFNMDATAFCVEGEGGCKDNEDGVNMAGVKVENLKGGINEQGIHFYSPMSGFADTMNSVAHVNQLSKMLTSPASLFGVTLYMTEPGVAAGANDMFVYANQTLQNRYHADRQYMDQMTANPLTYEINMRLFHQCVHDKLNPKTGSGTQKMPWVQAQSACMHDRLEAMDGENTFKDIPDAEMDFSSDPNHGSKNKWSPTKAEDSMTLTEYIFGQEWTASYATGYREQLLQDWRKIIGDYRFQIAPIENGSTNIRYVKVPGTQPLHELYKKQTEEVFKNLLWLMRYRCDWENGWEDQVNATDGTVEEEQQIPKDSPREDNQKEIYDLDYWAKENDKLDTALMMQVSMKGLRVSPRLADSFYFYFKNQFRSSTSATAIGGGKKRWDCDELISASYGSTAPLSQLRKTRERAEVYEYERMLFFLSQRIALGRILGTFTVAQQVLQSLSNSGYDNFIRVLGMQLLKDASGLEDIMLASQENLTEARDFVDEVYARVARETGGSSAVIGKLGGQRGTNGANSASNAFTGG